MSIAKACIVVITQSDGAYVKGCKGDDTHLQFNCVTQMLRASSFDCVPTGLGPIFRKCAAKGLAGYVGCYVA